MRFWTFLVGYSVFVALMSMWVEFAPKSTEPLNFLGRGGFFNILVFILLLSPLGWGVVALSLSFIYKRLKRRYSWFPYDEKDNY